MISKHDACEDKVVLSLWYHKRDACEDDDAYFKRLFLLVEQATFEKFRLHKN